MVTPDGPLNVVIERTLAQLETGGHFMTSISRLNRRNLFKTAAAGTAGLAAPQLFNINRTSAQEPVTLEYWNPGNDPVGGPIIQKLVDDFNATAGKDNGIVVHNVPTPTP